MTVLATIGYEGRTPDELTSLLANHSVTALIDVRQRASSRKHGFGKTALSQLLADEGILYFHFPELGTPADLRQQLRDGALDREEYLNTYSNYVVGQEKALVELERLIAGQRCCLLCMEADHQECHRSVLARLLTDRSRRRLSTLHL